MCGALGLHWVLGEGPDSGQEDPLTTVQNTCHFISCKTRGPLDPCSLMKEGSGGLPQKLGKVYADCEEPSQVLHFPAPVPLGISSSSQDPQLSSQATQ